MKPTKIYRAVSENEAYYVRDMNGNIKSNFNVVSVKAGALVLALKKIYCEYNQDKRMLGLCLGTGIFIAFELNAHTDEYFEELTLDKLEKSDTLPNKDRMEK